MNPEIDLNALQDKAENVSNLLKVMANKWRLLILCHLANEEQSVGDLETKLGLSQSALSQHLAVLRREHLVNTRRSAQSIYYSLASDDVKAVMITLYDRFCTTH